MDKVITFGNSKMMITLDYNGKCAVTGLTVDGRSVISGPAGIYSAITTSSNTYSTLKLQSVPSIKMEGNRVTISNINTWNGAFLGYGGLAWFYLFNEKLCTYRVHSDCSTFWNSATGDAIKVAVSAPGKKVAMKYSRSAEDHLIYNVAVSDSGLTYRYEAEKRSRFIRGKTDVWDSFTLSAGKYVQTITLSELNYNEVYNRGNFAGINDATYTQGYKQCLDFYRDNAIQPNWRVIARWAYLDEDAMPGTVTKEGFYEAQWGYLMDSNPDFVTTPPSATQSLIKLKNKPAKKTFSSAPYAGYKPDLALKYVENVLSRYEKDGLAFQRYGRIH